MFYPSGEKNPKPTDNTSDFSAFFFFLNKIKNYFFFWDINSTMN